MSAEATLETTIVDILTEAFKTSGVSVPVFGVLAAASAGTLKRQPKTSLSVKVYNLRQREDPRTTVLLDAELKLRVESSVDPDGTVSAAAHDSVSAVLQSLMDDSQDILTTADKLRIDYVQRTGGDFSFDSTTDAAVATWSLTVDGVVLDLTV